MAVLSDSDRVEIHSEYEDETFNDRRKATTLSRAEVRAAINALDAYMNDNAAEINAAIPQPARGVLTSEEKALLLAHVIRKRSVKGA